MIIVTFDPSLRNTGMCIMNNEDISVYSFKFTSTIKKTVVLYTLFNLIEMKLKKLSVDFFVVEDYPYHIKNSRSITSLAEAQGVIKAIAGKKEIPVIKIQNTLWKKIVGWKSLKKKLKEEKNFYCKECYKLFGREFDNPDQCDAFMILLAIRSILTRKQYDDTHHHQDTKDIYNQLQQIKDNMEGN